MNDRIVLTDDLLRRALQQRMAHDLAPQLLDRIVTAAATTPQDHAPHRWLRRGAGVGTARQIGSPWLRWPALASVAAVAVVAVLVVVALRPAITVPGATDSPPPTTTSSPAPTAAPATPGPTPVVVEVGGHAGLRLPLGAGADPIDVIFADGSIWTANIHGNDVRRYDPVTLEELARIPIPTGQGPAWFTATDGALWVTNQLGGGLNHIDTATNRFTEIVGSGPTCGAPVQAFDSIWQSACDAHRFLRIDPASRTAESIPAGNYGFLAFAGGGLITAGPETVAALDPDTYEFEILPYSVAGNRQLLESEGESLWFLTGAGIVRVDPESGETIATFPYTTATSVSFSDGSAWISVPFVGVVQVDLATNEEVQTIPLNVANPVIAREAAGFLWVTDYDNSALWRIEP